ncbi:MAG: hypothetical protein J7L12_04835 [Desulfurococcales archaeon]|nr:hypothetical protein [Desulfurococcales archaeon]
MQIVKVVKLGGSVITRKDKPFTVNVPVLCSLAQQIGRYLRENPQVALVLVHGGGSFGHTLVRECLSTYGDITQECFVRVAHYMMMLNSVVLEVLLANNVKAVSIPTRSICYVSSSEAICNVEQIRRYLDSGICPVVFGDVVIDVRSMRYVVVSGDRLAHIIAQKLGAKEVVFVTDVEGVFTSDPKKDRSARLIRELKASEVCSKVEFKEVTDVTGGMGAKVSELIRHCAEGTKILVVGGFIKDNLYNALSMKDFIGTTIWC